MLTIAAEVHMVSLDLGTVGGRSLAALWITF